MPNCSCTKLAVVHITVTGAAAHITVTGAAAHITVRGRSGVQAMWSTARHSPSSRPFASARRRSSRLPRRPPPRAWRRAAPPRRRCWRRGARPPRSACPLARRTRFCSSRRRCSRTAWKSCSRGRGRRGRRGQSSWPKRGTLPQSQVRPLATLPDRHDRRLSGALEALLHEHDCADGMLAKCTRFESIRKRRRLRIHPEWKYQAYQIEHESSTTTTP